MILKEFVDFMHRAMGLKSKNGAMMGKGSFLRELLRLNIDETQEPAFLDSPDSTFCTFIARGLSKDVAVELLKVLEQSKFIEKIDDLSDEQQEAIYQRLSQLHSVVDYENLSQSCADILKEIIHNSAFKKNRYKIIDADLSRHDKSEDALHELAKHWNKPKNVWMIHYACTNFNDPIYPARVTCIAMRPLSETSTKTFSIFDEAQKMQLNSSEISTCFDTLECNMLSVFFEFVQNLHHPVWLHWNMRDAKYGFEAIINRYRYLSTQCINNVFNKTIDVADYLKVIYGYDYADHPRLQSICKINNISLLNFITGDEEANAFQNGEFNKILNSTLRKINCMHSLVQMCANRVLKTKQDVYSSEPLSSCQACSFCLGIDNSAPIKTASS